MGMLQEPENFGPPMIGTKKKPFPVFGGSGCLLGVESGLTSRFVCARTFLFTNRMILMHWTLVPSEFSLNPMG